jgi:hypothetical protein
MSAVGQARHLWKNRIVLRLSVKEKRDKSNGGEGCLTIGGQRDRLCIGGGPGEWNGSAFERSPAVAEPGSGKP